MPPRLAGRSTEIAQATNDDGVANTARVSALVGKSARQISVLRARLMDKGIIESLRHGELAFTMSGFEAFVLEQERPAGRLIQRTAW